MIRQTLRPLARQCRRSIPSSQVRNRFFSTAPPHLKPRSWKSSIGRWGIALVGIYWYNTSPLFAEEPTYLTQDDPLDGRPLPTLDSLSPSARLKARPPDDSPAALEEEASQQGAFNEETGEINWDCPCLGGMAHGPCGEQFRAAFSCFVFSKEEPKGMDCIDKFKGMQECFREHPDVYGGELENGEEEEEEEEEKRKDDDGGDGMNGIEEEGSKDEAQGAVGREQPQWRDDGERAKDVTGGGPRKPVDDRLHQSSSESVSLRKAVYEARSEGETAQTPEEVAHSRSEDADEKKERALAAGREVKRVHGQEEAQSEGEELVPKAAHDVR